MTGHLIIPSGWIFYMESFRLPFIGRFTHYLLVKGKNIYAEMMLSFKGYYDLMQADKIKPDEKDMKKLARIKPMLSFIEHASDQTENEHLLEIRENIKRSLASIEGILDLFEKQRKYSQLKQDLFNASAQAITRNIEKHKDRDV